MSSVNVIKRLSRKSLAHALLLAFGVASSFCIVFAVPAVAQDAYPKGIGVGGGVWVLPGTPMTGVTSFSIRANYPGNASGGFVYAKGVGFSGPFSYRIAVEPDTAVILYRDDWLVWPAAPGEPDIVEGYAIWGIGKVVAAEGPNLHVGHWALVGAYDGVESESGTDYLVVRGFTSQNPQAEAEAAYEELLNSGNANYALWVFLAEGNAVLNVLED